MILNYTFKEVIRKESRGILSGFLTALRMFSEKILITKEKFTSAKFGDLEIRFFPLKEHSLDVVFVFDQGYNKLIKKLMSKIKKLISDFGFLFIHWDTVSFARFCQLEEPFLKTIKKELIYDQLRPEMFKRNLVTQQAISH